MRGQFNLNLACINLNKIFMEKVKIISYNPNYKKPFKELNYEWLNKYFEIEQMDEKILSNPQKIIDDGGQIFLPIINKEAISTVALLKMNESTFELAKMSVTEKHQGKSIGKKLCLTAIDYARNNNFKNIFLESNSKLTPALNLYKKLRFRLLPEKESSHYKRSDVKMMLNL